MLFVIYENIKYITCGMRDYVPNLSISVSTGEENKSDSLSSGERKESSQSWILVVGES